MNGQWDVYFCLVQDRPATIMLDLELAAGAPWPDMPVLASVNVGLLHPDESGLTKEEEFPNLLAIEDALLSSPVAREGAVYAGRCATNGRWTFFFYLEDARLWNDSIQSVMSRFPEYAWKATAGPEPEWETYLDFLYPDNVSLDRIQNDRVRRQLTAMGDNLALPRPIEHWLFFVDPEHRDAFLHKAEEAGFFIVTTMPPSATEIPPPLPEVTEMSEDAPLPPAPEETLPAKAETDASVTLTLQRTDAPVDMDHIALELRLLAESMQGVYLGWSTTAAAQETPASAL